MAKLDFSNESVTKVARITPEQVRSLQEEIRQTKQRERQQRSAEASGTPSPGAPQRHDAKNDHE